MKCRMLGLRTSIFLSLKRIWSKKSLNRDLRIYYNRKPLAIQQFLVLGLHRPAHQRASAPSKEEMAQLDAKLNQCQIKAVALSLIDPFADQFIVQSRSVPAVPEQSFCHKLVHSLSSLLFSCSIPATRRRNPLFLLLIVSSSCLPRDL